MINTKIPSAEFIINIHFNAQYLSNQTQSRYQSVISMLSINNAKNSSMVLLITTLIGLSASIGALAVLIIKQYLVFVVYSNPITCTASLTDLYQSVKYKGLLQQFIKSSDACVIVSIFAGLTALIMLIVFRVNLPKPPQKQQQQQQPQWSIKFHTILYVMFAISVVTLVVPTGYFLVFIIQVNQVCKYILTEWYIVAGLSGLALIIYLYNIFYLCRISYGLDETEQQEKPKQSREQIIEQKEEKQLHKQQINQVIGNDIDNKKETNQARQQVPNFFHADTFQNQSFRQEPNFINSFQNQQIREPLLPHNPQKSRLFQDSYESNRLKQLRRLRREQEEKIWDLQRKKKLIQLQMKQNPVQTNIKTTVQHQKPKDKESGNQTIINIHLASSQPNNLPAVIQQPKQKQASIVQKIKQSSVSKKSKKGKKPRATIYQEDSEDDSHYQYEKRQPKSKSKGRFDSRDKHQTINRFEPQQFHPLRLNQPVMLPEKVIEKNLKQKKKLSISHLHSVQIAPSLSPQNFSEKFQKSQVSQFMHNPTPPSPIEVSPKNQQSFFRKLLEQSQIRQRKVVQFNAPKKQKPKSIKKSSFQEKKDLNDYIQALNVSMNHMRSAYEQQYVSQKSNYSSVLSNKNFGAIPSEKFQKNRLSTFFNSQKLGNQAKALSLAEIQDKIHQKYKNVP